MVISLGGNILLEDSVSFLDDKTPYAPQDVLADGAVKGRQKGILGEDCTASKMGVVDA